MATADLHVLVEQSDSVTIVKLIGPIDSATFDQFKAAMQPVLREPVLLCVVDCSQLSYINSKGIGLLANLHRQAMISMGYAAFLGIAPRIKKTFDLLGLGKRLHIFEDVESAIAACKSARAPA